MKFGITEQGDAGLDFSWEDRLCEGNILITKNLNDKFIEKVLKHKDKVIIHIGCTGFGRTEIEPNVPPCEWTYEQTIKLLKYFPVKQTVLRIDPIMIEPYTQEEILDTKKSGIARHQYQDLQMLLEDFKDTGIKRVRYSFLDMYRHVELRLKTSEMKIAKPEPSKVYDIFNQFDYEYESCAEKDDNQIGCISQKDFNILGLSYEADSEGYQRKECKCHSGKTELLRNKKQCSHGCLYCYWGN